MAFRFAPEVRFSLTILTLITLRGPLKGIFVKIGERKRTSRTNRTTHPGP
jgi:hypothetical protein